MGRYSDSEQRAMDQESGRQEDAHRRARERYSCSHSLVECVGCEVVRVEAEKREALETARAENERLRALLVKVAGASHIPGAPLSLLEMYHPSYSCEAPLVCGTCTVRAEIRAALKGTA